LNIENFITELKKLNINITSIQLEQLRIYKEMLLEYNEKFNLTAITTPEDIYLKHFYDSLTLIKACDLTEKLTILDIGTGAGFPGLVLKIVFPNLDITLIDSNKKKIGFLQDVIKKLKLENITTIITRAECLDKSYRHHFDIVTSRAVASLRILTELAIPYTKEQGYFIAMKGLSAEEVAEASSTIALLNSEITDIIEFTLPDNTSNRSLIVIKKNQVTSPMYPRDYDKILHKPLK